MKTYDQLIKLFECANEQFLGKDSSLLLSDVNERTLCGALMLHIHDQIKDDKDYDGYYTDVEYNRNRGKIKTAIKSIQGPRFITIRINCDLILHSRGEHPEQDNLIAVEMKKSSRPNKGKDEDRDRLKALTADSYDSIWSFDGQTLPEHVCRYILGVYYEIDMGHDEIRIEYYRKGEIERKINLSVKREGTHDKTGNAT